MEEFKPLKYLKLPFQFDKKRLQQDLDLIVGKNWTSHYNRQAYEGAWKLISLYSSNGKEEDIFASQNPNLELRPTALMKNCQYLSAVIDEFKCPLLSVRLLKLSVGAHIKPHRDYKLGYENDNFRIHIPIRTNSKVKFLLGGERLHMLEGTCWYTNVNYIHAVSNEGVSDRIHLVIDCQRNKWSDQLFFSIADKKQLIPNRQDQEIEMYQNMIKNLKKLAEPASKELINRYEQKIAAMQRR